MKFTFPMIIKADYPTAAGNIYPKEVLEKAFETKARIPIFTDKLPEFEKVQDVLTRAIGFMNSAKINENKKIEVDCEIIKPDMINSLDVMKDDVKFVLAMSGSVQMEYDEQKGFNVVQHINLQYFVLQPQE